MTQELSQKSEEIRKYHAEQAVVFSRIRELVGHPGMILNKARLYDQLVESGEPVSARPTIPILVKYSRMMNNLFAEIQKWFRQAELLEGYSTRDHPDRQLELSTR
jgi:hypothetical protein